MIAQMHRNCQGDLHEQAELVYTLEHKQCRSTKGLLSVRHIASNVNELNSRSQSSLLVSKNRVHFEVDENDEIISHIQNANERLVITEDEIEAMWWRNDEFMHFKRSAKKHSQAYKETDSKDFLYTTRFNEALEVCSNSSGHLENIPIVSNTKVRGLEMYIFPEVLVKQRRRVIHSILKVQAMIPESMTPDHKARLLNAASKDLTRPMRRLSRLLAIGDARVVAQLDTPDYPEDDFH